MSRAPRLFLYVQHLLGIGHLTRARAIARAAAKRGFSVAVVSGGMPVSWAGEDSVRLIQLPPAKAGDHGFSFIADQDGRPIDEEWRDRRRHALLDAFSAERPDMLLLEMFPFGRRQFHFELLPLLAAARGLPVAASVRDILVPKHKPARDQEVLTLIRDHFDCILVHGDAAVAPFNFPRLTEIADKLIYTGYVLDRMPEASPPSGEILVSAGGGAVGAPLLAAALAARPRSAFKDRPWRIITGANLPEDTYRALAQAAGGSVVLERFREDFPRVLGACTLSISQGGYNTVLETLALRKRAVIVPFTEGGESEQILRARLLAERGWCVSLDEQSLDELPRAIDQAAALTLPAIGLAMKGAEASAEILWELHHGRLGRSRPRT
jgi:predicted glycosyltransferase